MSLTKKDLSEIEKLVKKDLSEIEKLINKSIYTSFEQLFIPYVDATSAEIKAELKSEIRELREEMDFRFKSLRGDMNEGFATVHSRIDDAIALNGRYYEDCATKKEHNALEKRVKKLEVAK